LRHSAARHFGAHVDVLFFGLGKSPLRFQALNIRIRDLYVPLCRLCSCGCACRLSVSDLLARIQFLYRSNSFLELAISCLCNTTTANVASPTSAAAIAAIAKNVTIKFSQECNERPNICLTLLEKISLFLVGVSRAGLCVIMFLAIGNLVRGR
jgi:hypothetical protein